jgi:diaminohydroxyphosphoribosylaminopyrimidine deaminase/5-amino-6-(5-phosphoribosylamino)uracil reductase
MDKDKLYMQRALELAQLGAGKVSPNPMVGCVIVHKDKIVGEGFHKQYGGPHAEVNAVKSVADSSILSDSTAYVTLEPCSHFGKTPPCADLLIHHKLKRVVIASGDPNPKVNGRGVKKMREAGIEVDTGLLADQADWLNRRFMTFHTQKRPYVILKWAQTSDGFVARENFDSKWISNRLARQLVHKLRAEEDAIMVGYNTALHDNPRLNVREWSGQSPVRVLLDLKLQLPERHNLFDNSVETIIFNSEKEEQKDLTHRLRIDPMHPYESILQKLFERDIQSVIVEGGSKTLQQLIGKGYWDEAHVYISKANFGSGLLAPTIDGELKSVENVSDNILQRYQNANRNWQPEGKI